MKRFFGYSFIFATALVSVLSITRTLAASFRDYDGGQTRIYSPTAGRYNPEIAVFVPGFKSNIKEYHHILLNLTDTTGRRIITFDLYGQGVHQRNTYLDNTPYYVGSQSFNAYVNQLTSVIYRYTGSSKIILMGHSLGAAIAAKYAYLVPTKVRKLILMSPFTRLPIPQGPSYVAGLANVDSEGTLNHLLDRMTNEGRITAYLDKPTLAAEVAKAVRVRIRTLWWTTIAYIRVSVSQGMQALNSFSIDSWLGHVRYGASFLALKILRDAGQIVRQVPAKPRACGYNTWVSPNYQVTMNYYRQLFARYKWPAYYVNYYLQLVHNSLVRTVYSCQNNGYTPQVVIMNASSGLDNMTPLEIVNDYANQVSRWASSVRRYTGYSYVLNAIPASVNNGQTTVNIPSNERGHLMIASPITWNWINYEFQH